MSIKFFLQKNFVAIVALSIVAISVSAFSMPEKKMATKLFRYTAPAGSYQQADVEDRDNWTYISSGTQVCPLNTNEKACELQVDDSQINPDNTLKSSMTITAQPLTTDPDISFVKSATSSTPHNTPL